MYNYLTTLQAGGWAFVFVAILFMIVELIKAFKYLWDLFAPKILKIKTKESEEKATRKEINELTRSNAETINTFITTQNDFNKKISTRMDTLENRIDDIAEMQIDMNLEDMRSKILDFASSIGEGKRNHTREQYRYIMKIHKNYDDLVRKTNRTNDEVDISYDIIMNSFRIKSESHSFLEDIMDPESLKKNEKNYDHDKILDKIIKDAINSTDIDSTETTNEDITNSDTNTEEIKDNNPEDVNNNTEGEENIKEEK